MKYIIFDFGKVLAYPPTGVWTITPLFLDLIDIKTIDKYGYDNNIKIPNPINHLNKTLSEMNEE